MEEALDLSFDRLLMMMVTAGTSNIPSQNYAGPRFRDVFLVLKQKKKSLQILRGSKIIIFVHLKTRNVCQVRTERTWVSLRNPEQSSLHDCGGRCVLVTSMS